MYSWVEVIVVPGFSVVVRPVFHELVFSIFCHPFRDIVSKNDVRQLHIMVATLPRLDGKEEIPFWDGSR